MNLLPSSYVLRDNDVLCGRGSLCYNHQGNRNFRYIITANLKRYMMAQTKYDKSEIICAVVRLIQSSNYNGAFIKKDLETGRFYEISDIHAREKTSQTFRLLQKSTRSLDLVINDQSRKCITTSALKNIQQPETHMDGVIQTVDKKFQRPFFCDETTSALKNIQQPETHMDGVIQTVDKKFQKPFFCNETPSLPLKLNDRRIYYNTESEEQKLISNEVPISETFLGLSTKNIDLKSHQVSGNLSLCLQRPEYSCNNLYEIPDCMNGSRYFLPQTDQDYDNGILFDIQNSVLKESVGTELPTTFCDTQSKCLSFYHHFDTSENIFQSPSLSKDQDQYQVSTSVQYNGMGMDHRTNSLQKLRFTMFDGKPIKKPSMSYNIGFDGRNEIDVHPNEISEPSTLSLETLIGEIFSSNDEVDLDERLSCFENINFSKHSEIIPNVASQDHINEMYEPNPIFFQCSRNMRTVHHDKRHT